MIAIYANDILCKQSYYAFAEHILHGKIHDIIVEESQMVISRFSRISRAKYNNFLANLKSKTDKGNQFMITQSPHNVSLIVDDKKTYKRKEKFENLKMLLYTCNSDFSFIHLVH